MASILGIDDGPNIRSLLRTALEDTGRTVVEAVNGHEGQPWTATVSGLDSQGCQKISHPMRRHTRSLVGN